MDRVSVRGAIAMVRVLSFFALIGAVALIPATWSIAQHHHHGGHGHGHGHGGHFGGGHHHHGHHGHHHFGHHHGHHHHFGHYHNFGHHHHHLGWYYGVPSYYYPRAYYYGYGSNYYVPRSYVFPRTYVIPRTYVADPGAVVAARPVEAEARGIAQVDDLSGYLVELANEVCLDLHYNYRHNQGFEETYRDAYEILNSSKFVQANENQGDRAEVIRRLDAMVGLLHKVREQVRGWSRQHSRQIGQAGALTKLDAIEATVNRLVSDLGAKGAHGTAEIEPTDGGTEVAPAPQPEPAPGVETPVPLPPQSH
jgi:hypothetical protein